MTSCTSTKAAVCAAALAAMLGGCATPDPRTQPWKPAPIGANWMAAQRNTGSFGKDTQTTTTRLADMDWNGSPALVLKTANGMLLQQPADGRWLAFLSPDGKPTVTFDPPAGWSQPIAVGDNWKRAQKVTNVATGGTREHEWGCTVAAYEKVTVPAGSFDAYRVECSSSLDTQDTYWVTATVHPFLKTRAVRGVKHPSGPGTQETELLKAPS
ncbi:MAG: hypothetical protein JNL30_09560 [Rubrivivax sp.]|nr:hypothetical protein [Rubrivivax sp.]